MLTTCLHPKTVRNKATGKLIYVPCGKCVACMSLKSLSWQQRLEQECVQHKYTMFVTLTYAPEFLPLQRMEDIPCDVYAQFDSKSLELVKLYGGVPYASVHDMQCFFKNFRNRLAKENINEKIRYYYLAEYGSTTLRPHFHLLVWFSDDTLYQRFESYLHTSWVFNNQDLHRSFLRGNIDFKPVGVSVCRYVTSYVASNSSLPNCFPLLGLAQFSAESRKPPIGYGFKSNSLLSQSVYGLTFEKSVYESKLCVTSNVPYWPSDTSYLFPKCYKFGSFNDKSKFRMYALTLSVPHAQGFDSFFAACRFMCSAFLKKYELNQYSSISSNTVIEQFLLENFTSKVGKTYIWEKNRLRSAYYVSCRVLRNCRRLGMRLPVFISYLLEYYARLDYACLKKQIEYEQQLSSSCALRFYPLLIDKSIVNNERNLKVENRAVLLSSFGYENFDLEYPLFVAENSIDYKAAAANYEKIYRDSIKSKVKNDYLAAHPEFNKLYNL